MAEMISRAKDTLQRQPRLSYEETPGRLFVPRRSDSGFDVGIAEWPRKATGAYITVFFEPGKLHEDFEDVEQALELFRQALCGSARIKVTALGGVDCIWTLEVARLNTWCRMRSSARFWLPVWRRRSVRYLENAVSPQSETE